MSPFTMPNGIHGSGRLKARNNSAASSAYSSCDVSAHEQKKVHLLEDMRRSLEALVIRDDEEVRHRRVVQAWHDVAAVLDGLMLRLFMVLNVTATIVLILIIPLTYNMVDAHEEHY